MTHPSYAFATATAPGSTGSTSVALQPPPGDPSAVAGVVTLADVELAIEGTWNASTGTAPLSRATFESILAAAADPEVDQAPAHFGHFDPRFPHLSDGEPAVGWVRPTRIEQRSDGRSVLIGNITDVPASLVPVIRHAYKRRSIEFATGLTTPGGRSYPAAMTGLGLLGVRPPAVKGLAELSQRYLSAPTMPANVALQAVLVEDVAGDTPAAGGWFPVAGVPAGHDWRVNWPTLHTGEPMPTRLTDDRVRQLLALSANDDVSAVQATIAALPSQQAQPPAAPPQPQPPAGWFVPPGYAPAGAQPTQQQPAAGAQPPPAYQPGGPAQPYFQPVTPPPAAATVGAQPAASYLQPAPAPAAAPQQPVYYQPAPAQPAYPQQPAYYPPAQPAQPAQPVAYAQPGPLGYPAGQPQQYPATYAQPGQQPAYQPPAANTYPPPGLAPLPYAQPGQPADPGQQLGQPQPFAPPAQPGYVAAAAGPQAPAGMVLMGADAAAQVGAMLTEHQRNRRDVTAWQAFSSGKISAHEYPGIRAELDRDEQAATHLLGLLAPGRYQVQAYGVGAGAAVYGEQTNDAAFAGLEAELLGRPAPSQQAQQAPASQNGI